MENTEYRVRSGIAGASANVRAKCTGKGMAAGIARASTLVVCIYLALFQSGLVSYTGSHIGRARWLTAIIFGVYMYAGVISIWAMIRGHVARRPVIAVWTFALLCMVPVIVTGGSIGPVTKSYAIGLASVSVLCVAARCGDLRRVAQFSAAVIGLASIGCLIDVCFYNGLGQDFGRAAFLYSNSNVAAVALLLGAVGAAWSIPLRWLLSFLVLVAGAIFATLSRSALITSVLALAACIPVLFENFRVTTQELRAGVRGAVVVGVCVVALLAVAWNANRAFPVAIDSGFHGLTTAIKWLRIGNSRLASVGENADVMGETIRRVERENSVLARALLAERAWRQFRTGPATGIGLERAFALAPHNSYLLFADAFGYIGWLIIPALASLILFLGRRRGLPAAVVVSVAALFSHDLLFALPLVSSFVLIFARADVNSLIRRSKC